MNRLPLHTANLVLRLDMFIAWSRELPRKKYQLAVTQQDGTLVGSCGVRMEGPGIASFGIEIGRAWHGTGGA